MSWKRPGKNVIADIDGIKITFKPMTQGERIDYAHSLSELPSLKNVCVENITSEQVQKRFNELIEMMAEHIVKIDIPDFEGSVVDILKWQSNDLLLKISNAIIEGAGLNETEVKN